MNIQQLLKEWHLESEEKFLKTPVGVFLLGAFLGELAPDPTDAIHFWLQEYLLSNPSISVPLRAFLQIFDWYFMSALYFLLLLLLAYALHIQKVGTVRRITIV
ncbi:hypothetical protein HY970_00285, partial [Candidatus Kaiserbacteria bacterium]|nr:hypothetical protein [Candidatus Kaiserbacteria bacterium]